MKQLINFFLFSAIIKAYYLDDRNYFYVNTSYNLGIVSFSACFNFGLPATITFNNSLLFSSALIGQLKEQNKVLFNQNAPKTVTNSYFEGEHWFAFKMPFSEIKEFLTLFIQIDFKNYTNPIQLEMIMFMMDLPLSAVPIFTFFNCGNVLISYNQEKIFYDITAFGLVGTFKEPSSRPKWGFAKKNRNIYYLRRKHFLEEVKFITNQGFCILQQSKAFSKKYKLSKQEFNLLQMQNLNPALNLISYNQL